jgi:hypothetical protein
MSREEMPISPEQMPEEARRYMSAIQEQQAHPFVRQHFFQVTWLAWMVPNHGKVEFFALEFRVGKNAALIWEDGQGNWGAGKWLPLAHADADITCPPTQLSLQYFQGAKAHATLAAAVEELVATSPA